MNALQRKIIEFCYRRRKWYWLARLLIDRWDGGEMNSTVLRDLLASHHKVVVGRYSYGPMLRRGRVPRGTRVGHWTSVGRDLIVSRRNHPIERINQHPFFYSRKWGYVPADTIEEVTDNPLEIGHDVWIGDRVTILSTCKSIGNGAVLAAGAVVTRDVPPYAIMGGVPAKPLRDRFPPEIQRHLDESQWWFFDAATMQQLQPMLLQPLTEELAAAFAARCRELRSEGRG